MKEKMGDRMKDYERRFKYLLPKRGYFILRLDGRAFHTYTRGFKRPFDDIFMECMNETAKYLCENIMGAKLAYVQSDEITVLFTDFDNIKTECWFQGVVAKVLSISASMATAKFLEMRRELADDTRLASFDSRVFSISDSFEVENVFIWRQLDATRNSIQSVAQSFYSHRELRGKNTSQLQEMIFQAGQNWNDYSAKYKRGRVAIKEEYSLEDSEVTRTRWIIKEPPIFTQDRDFLRQQIPLIPTWSMS